MNKKVVTLLLVSGFLLSSSVDVSLKKDEEFSTKIRVNSPGKVGQSADKIVKMRWTLYKNDGIVLHLKYDQFPYQFVLYEQHGLNEWSLNLSDPQGMNRETKQPRIRVFFKNIKDAYVDSKAIAEFRIYTQGDVSTVD